MMTRDITATPEYRQVFAWLRGGDTTPDPQMENSFLDLITAAVAQRLIANRSEYERMARAAERAERRAHRPSGCLSIKAMLEEVRGETPQTETAPLGDEDLPEAEPVKVISMSQKASASEDAPAVELDSVLLAKVLRHMALIEEKELKVDYVWPHEYEITADEGRITQAVTNLVSNAIKYSPRGGTIYVSVTKTKDKVIFAIENQSQPLSDEALENVWDSFYRTDKSRTEKGTGLGLPITKAIVELHGGTCHVSNTETGVEFKFYLP